MVGQIHGPIEYARIDRTTSYVLPTLQQQQHEVINSDAYDIH